MKHVGVFLLSFYLFGTLLLPVGDFSVLPDLPKMFAHCKATEDEDLNVFEFFTEHLTGIDQLLCGVEHEENNPGEAGDKPHAPLQMHLQIQLVVCNISTIKLPQVIPQAPKCEQLPASTPLYLSNHISTIFRPPIA